MTWALNDDDRFSIEGALVAEREIRPGATRVELVAGLLPGWESAFGESLAATAAAWLLREVPEVRRCAQHGRWHTERQCEEAVELAAAAHDASD